MGTSPSIGVAGPAGQVVFETHHVAPPSRVYITLNDVFVFAALGTVANNTLTLGLRILKPDGNLSYSAIPLLCSSDRSVASMVFPMLEGFLLSAIVSTSVEVQRGQCYVLLRIKYGSAGGVFQEQLLQGYVSIQQPLSWPEAPPDYFVSGKGNLRTIVGTTPGAGVEILETVPAGATWRLHSFQTALTTSGVAGNRTPRLTLDDGINQFFKAESLLQQAASLTKTHQWAENVVGFVGNVDTAVMPLPGPIYLKAGSRIQTVTQGLLGGDQWAAPQYNVEEWIEQ